MYSGFPLRSNFPSFPYPVHGKFMVGFFIQVNEKTNHKFPMYGIRKEGKFERRGNPLYSGFMLRSNFKFCRGLFRGLAGAS